MGRSPYCTIVLSNPQSSRQHCALRLDGDVLYIADLNSANGTWVNDAPVTEPRKLEAGDVIRIGTDVLEVLPTLGGSAEDRARPTTNHRRSPDTGNDDSTDQMIFDDAPHTQTAATQLELVEALVASASETRRPATLAPMLQRVIESLIQQHALAGRPIVGADATRVAAVIEILASWSSELANWRTGALAALGAVGQERSTKDGAASDLNKQ